MKLQFGWRLLRLAPVLALAACASGGTEQADQAGTPGNVVSDLAIIEVLHNDPSVTSAATVIIEPQAGVRATLGIVDPGQTKQFTYNARAGNYRLVIPGGKSSDYFRLSNREIATWDLMQNRVRPRNK